MTEKRGLKRADLERPPPGPQEDETDASAAAVISVEEVAAETGYTTGAVYSNFAGKEELFLALYTREVEKRLEDCRAVVDAVGSPQTVGQAASERFGDFIRDDPKWPLLFLRVWAYGARNERLWEECVRQREAEVKIIAKAVERQTAVAGVELPLSAEQVAVGIGALINGLAFERTLDPASLPDELWPDPLPFDRWAIDRPR